MVKSTVQCSACQRSPMGRCLSHTTLPFGKYGPQAFRLEGMRWGYYPALKGEKVSIPAKTFDEVPLGYLDWLSGQDYVNYGWLRERLTKYLTRDVIQRELAELFPDPDDDTRQPAFSPIGNAKFCRDDSTVRYFVTAKDVIGSLFCPDGQQATAEFTLGQVLERQQSLTRVAVDIHDKWNAQPMPKEFIPELDPEDAPMRDARAWDIVADAAIALDNIDSQDSWDEFHRIRYQHELRRALKLIGTRGYYTAIAKLREHYRTAIMRVKAIVTSLASIDELTLDNQSLAITSIERIR